jgi:hypothetical protein
MKLILILLLACVPAFAQEKTNLQAKYGTPKSETYSIRPGIDLTVVRNGKGDICSMLIFPETRAESLLVGGAEETLDEGVLNEIIDELVPSEQRGKFERGFVENTFCISDCGCTGNGNLSEYERVYIFLARSKVKTEKRYAEIRWKTVACDN